MLTRWDDRAPHQPGTPVPLSPGAASGHRLMTHVQGVPRQIRIPGDRTLHATELGTGSPTVVLEAGAAATRSSALVQPLVATFARTVVYDRAGLGRSAPDPVSRTMRRMADDLGALLGALGSDRFVLVGHSAGGPIVRLAAADAPERIAGLVLVDPSDEASTVLLARAFPHRFRHDHTDPGRRQRSTRPPRRAVTRGPTRPGAALRALRADHRSLARRRGDPETGHSGPRLAGGPRGLFEDLGTHRDTPVRAAPRRPGPALGQDGPVIGGAGRATAPALVLPGTGPDPMPLDTAVAALLGYARGRRPLRFRSFDWPQGHWVELPAFGWTRFDTLPTGPNGDSDVLLGEGLHGRLDRPGWTDVRHTLTCLAPLAVTAAERAAGLPLWELADDELSVLGEPGTVGAAFREIDQASGAHPAHVRAILHHQRPALVPHLTRATRRALLPHALEGDSGVEAVVRRELRANAEAFSYLEHTVAALLGDARPTRLRLHDILLWLATTLRLTHAVALGEATPEWQVHLGTGR